MVLLLQGMSLFAQKEANIWYFGDSAGLDFNTNPPTALTNSAMNAWEGSSSIADKNGNLLFYSDGITVWNKNHQIMTNGTGLLGHPSSTHSCLIIKWPSIDSIYFIFTTSEFGSNNGVCYSIIDLRLSGQLGAVTTKNIKLVNFSAEKIAAITHANQRDIWVAIPAQGSDTIYTFLVTPSGIDSNTVKNTTGIPLISYSAGQIKFSNDATKFASANYNDIYSVIILDFNNLNGTFSNLRTIYGQKTYGLEFSPNTQYLYLTVDKKLVQCSLSSPYNNMINFCKTIDTSSQNLFGQLQSGPDNKIYIVNGGDGYPGSTSSYIGSISNPDYYFLSCGYSKNYINLIGKSNGFGLPSFNKTYFTTVGFISAHSSCLGDSSSVSIRIDSSSVDSINWFIGDTITPIIHGSKTTKFKYLNADTTSKVILAKVYSLSSVQKYYDTLKVFSYPKLNLSNDSSICVGDSIILKATYPGADYVWQDGKTDSIYKVKFTGLYKVISTLNGCSVKDSTRITVNAYPNLNLGKDTFLCSTSNYKLRATYTGANYLWQDSSTDSIYLATNSGLYWVKSDYKGCIKYDSVKITIRPKPIVNIGNDTLICGDTIFKLKATYPLATNYLWSNNSTDSILTINKRGKYWVQVTDSGCVSIDTISIVLKAFPTINLGNDTVICQFKNLILKTNYSNANFLWSDGSKDSILEINKAGKYWLTVNDSSCTSYDTIEIRYKNLPAVNIANDTIVCGATNYQIKPNYSFTYNYLWSDNSTDSVLNINKNGKYWVIVNDSGCVNKDTISIILKAFPTINLGNDTMICENNNLILNANYSNADYLWSDNSKDSIFEVNKAGKYWLSVTDSSCVSSDTIEVRYHNLPIVNLGNDTSLCNNATLLLTAPPNYQSYLWNDLSTADSLLVSREGLYSVTVNDSGCLAQDEIKVSYLETPNVNLCNDTSFCEGIPFYLKATNPKTNYLWSNFSTDSIIKITQSGIYWLKAYNACGTSFDTIEIKIEACNCYIYVPNAFTPNSNDINEVFLPVSNCKITNYQIIILNRWGVKIFESNNPNIGWNGKLNEILQSNDVYVYQLQAELIDNFIGTNKKQVSLKGNITLLN